MRKTTLFKVLITVAAAALIAASLPLSIVAEPVPATVAYEFTEADKGWYNAGADEMTISTRGELAYFAELAKTNTFAGKTVKLGADIAWSDGQADEFGFTCSSQVMTWTPIGPNTNTPFQGVFDGQGHTISGICIDSTTQNMAVFGVVKNSTIKNVRFSDVFIRLTKNGEKTPSWTGIVVSQSWGDNVMSDILLTDCYILGDVENSEYIGGLVGCVASATGNNTYTSCAFVNGLVQGKDAVGGLLGLVRNKKTVTLEGCACGADINAACDGAGLIGRLCGNSVMKNCWYYGNLSVSEAATGAGLAYLEKEDQGGTVQPDASTADFTDCYTTCPSPVAVSVLNCDYTVTASFAGGAAESYSCLGNAADNEKMASMFVLPVTVEGKADAAVRFEAAQNYTDGGKKCARLVASIKDSGAAKVAGFNVTLVSAEGYNKLGDISCKSVFASLNAVDAAGSMKKDLPEALFALSFRGIPEQGTAVFITAPFSASAAGAAKTYAVPSVSVFVDGIYVGGFGM